MFTAPDPARERQRAQQTAFLDLVVSERLIVDCVTFDTLEGEFASPLWLPSAESQIEGQPQVPFSVETPPPGVTPYSAPHVLYSSPTQEAADYRIVLRTPRRGIGLWVIGNLSASPNDSIEYFSAAGTRVRRMAMPAAPGGEPMFAGIVSDVPIALVVVHDASADSDRVGIDHLWLAQERTGFRDDVWRIRWFRCDHEGGNDFLLERDGTPVCGSTGCPSRPAGCWGPAVTARSWSEGGIEWGPEDERIPGYMRLTHEPGVHVYGEARIRCRIVRMFAVGEQLRFWSDGKPLERDSLGMVDAGGGESWRHVEWTTYEHEEVSSVCLSRDNPSFSNWQQASGEVTLSLEVEPPGAGRTDPPVGSHRGEFGDFVPIEAFASQCFAFDRWGDFDYWGNPVLPGASNRRNSIVLEGDVTAKAVFRPGEPANLKCTIDRTTGCVDLAWENRWSYASITVERSQHIYSWETVAQLTGDTEAWRDTKVDATKSFSYRLRVVCGDVGAAETDACTGSFDYWIEVGNEVTLELNALGSYEVRVPLAFHAPYPLQGFSFGFTYDADVCHLTGIVYTGDELGRARFGPYWATNINPTTMECVDHSVGGGTASAVFDEWRQLPPDAGDRIELVFSVGQRLRGCCRLRFVNCLNDPGTPTVIVWGGASIPAGIVGGEGCFGPRVCPDSGDSNDDERVDIGDAICVLAYLFGPREHACKPLVGACLESSDVNKDGRVDIADAVVLLRRLFPE